ncbi:MAG: hypothetical protein A2381_02765 [Bdellovibrionales bacterium RIFOXYB1_FULL_37_110]|nr:MAG: hypothetical protein A2181_05145 [Bdellovibrionales bacterium RIFOXYA1_FULL_38_20]OFZ52620.1 MAG: hypothetical protein A2417_01100 [Bdellovibrionales bacterium RIFOXYC1_FULL_37_79]OFZ58310.1 MAG: hypothetical protein A2381_02765 [Bdellovibrionales bacterium RIFOXYB1_FULL_37_110]OFZ65271.1 MAG: hypothetical protein A2577_03950 [Bdellovibrionales bacterium RIFOXYD1_FULL_36_51]
MGEQLQKINILFLSAELFIVIIEYFNSRSLLTSMAIAIVPFKEIVNLVLRESIRLKNNMY